MKDCDNISELECQLIHKQIARREKYRLEFLQKRTDPCLHSLEAGYVFDPAIQKFMSMKTLNYQQFKANPRTAFAGFLAILPMFIYGAAIWKERNDREFRIRCGKLRYRDRLFKLQ